MSYGASLQGNMAFGATGLLLMLASIFLLIVTTDTSPPDYAAMEAGTELQQPRGERPRVLRVSKPLAVLDPSKCREYTSWEAPGFCGMGIMEPPTLHLWFYGTLIAGLGTVGIGSLVLLVVSYRTWRLLGREGARPRGGGGSRQRRRRRQRTPG